MIMEGRETIRIRNLSTGYVGKGKSVVVTEGIHATLRSGELTCLLGVNGVGKSTLLRTLSAFLPPLGGTIEIKGKRLSDYTDKQLATTIGVVLTEKCSLRNMTVEELVGMGRSPYTGFWGRLNQTDRKIVADALAVVKITELKHRMVQTLSDGERQKAMIAKALAQETPVIFLDEPTAFLDFPSKVEIMQLLHRLSRTAGKTVFFSTHDLELALQMADQIWLMDKASGVQTGTPEDLSLNGTLSRFCLGRGITFDCNTGLFRAEDKYRAELRVTGSGTRWAMVCKALRRNGIRATASADSDTSVEVEEMDYLLRLPNGKIFRALTIEALLEGLACTSVWKAKDKDW